MSQETKVGRRDLLKGAAGTVLGPALLAKRGANDRLGVACIGVGTRGHELLQEARDIPNVEIRVVCDVYTRNIERARRLSNNPKVRAVHEWEKAIADPDVDVVLIATPDFWHARMVLAAADAGKDMYTEKGWCTNLADAKKMRKTIKERQVVMQLGHQYRASPYIQRAREIYRSGQLGAVNVIRILEDRTFQEPYWRFYEDYGVTEFPKDASPRTIDWDRWIAAAPHKLPFNSDRFFTWRCWWDYGTGIAGDLMTHLWDSVNFVTDIGIPETACTQGGIYFWKGDRDVPDNWNVLFDYPHRDLAVTFSCTQMNKHSGGDLMQFLGREQTLEAHAQLCRTYEGEWKPQVAKRIAEFKKAGVAKGMKASDVFAPPDYSLNAGPPPPGGQFPAHMADFFRSVRSRGTPACGVDQAFEEAATLCMSVESFRQGRRVRWDRAKEEIV